MPKLRLGLIGDNIAASQAPKLHRLAGAQFGADVTYDLLIPEDHGLPLADLIPWARSSGYAGLNITYPYKELAIQFVDDLDPRAAMVGAVNTLVFRSDATVGFNTDMTGAKEAFSSANFSVSDGPVTIIGAGGAGRAIAWALLDLGVPELRVVDKDDARAASLCAHLCCTFPSSKALPFSNAVEATKGAAGLVNCTPVGMVGHEGTPLPQIAMAGAHWAFDAVYTPANTTFLRDAKQSGLAVLSGVELFFCQGVHAWSHFDGRDLDQAKLRHDLGIPTFL